MGQLGKGKAKELIPAGECFYAMVTVVSGYAFTKLILWRHLHDLRENRHPETHKTPQKMLLG
jgi:hypothetical protein